MVVVKRTPITIPINRPGERDLGGMVISGAGMVGDIKKFNTGLQTEDKVR